MTQKFLLSYSQSITIYLLQPNLRHVKHQVIMIIIGEKFFFFYKHSWFVFLDKEFQKSLFLNNKLLPKTDRSKVKTCPHRKAFRAVLCYSFIV